MAARTSGQAIIFKSAPTDDLALVAMSHLPETPPPVREQAFKTQPMGTFLIQTMTQPKTPDSETVCLSEDLGPPAWSICD